MTSSEFSISKFAKSNFTALGRCYIIEAGQLAVIGVVVEAAIVVGMCLIDL